MENQNSKTGQWIAIAIIIASLLISGSILYTKFGVNPGGGGTAIENGQPGKKNVDVANVDIVGDPFIGNENAPAVMAYWSDYQCPFCKRHEELVMPQIVKNYVDSGKLKIVFKDYAFLGPDSQRISRYARGVWEVAPQKYYTWYKAMFDNQGDENTGWATDVKIMSITINAIGATDAQKVSALTRSKGDEYQKRIDMNKAEGTSMGVDGTPASIIGKQIVVGAQSYDTFKSAIDAALAGK